LANSCHPGGINLSIKEAVMDVARGWFTVAERVARLDREQDRSERSDKKRPQLAASVLRLM
jgi:hypothetical protein